MTAWLRRVRLDADHFFSEQHFVLVSRCPPQLRSTYKAESASKFKIVLKPTTALPLSSNSSFPATSMNWPSWMRQASPGGILHRCSVHPAEKAD